MREWVEREIWMSGGRNEGMDGERDGWKGRLQKENDGKEKTEKEVQSEVDGGLKGWRERLQMEKDG